MKKLNIYNHYDDTKTVIGKIIPNQDVFGRGKYITERTYKRLLKNRVVGGEAGIYADSMEEILVVNPHGFIIGTI